MESASASDLVIEPLAGRHVREGFSCGSPALDNYLIRQAGQDSRRNSAAVFVLVRRGLPQVLGYYTLSASAVDLEELTGPGAAKLPRYPSLPAILIGRLAIDARLQGGRLGSLLIVNAIERSLGVVDVGWSILFVSAKDEAAARFYERHDFKRCARRSDWLFILRDRLAVDFKWALPQKPK